MFGEKVRLSLGFGVRVVVVRMRAHSDLVSLADSVRSQVRAAGITVSARTTEGATGSVISKTANRTADMAGRAAAWATKAFERTVKGERCGVGTP
jgi:hypothetical protein